MKRSITNGNFPPVANAAVVVAHPDDEVLWCGGWILEHPGWRWRIVTLCRASDSDRAPKFCKVLEQLGAEGTMADLNDGPDQIPLNPKSVMETVASLLPDTRFDMVLTHGPHGEYTRHRRHEECCRAVVRLWEEGRIRTDQLWLFAYHDGRGKRLPTANRSAHHRAVLAESTWREKLRLMTGVYGFPADGWEARCTPREEAFWCFDSSAAAAGFLESNHNLS